MRFRTLHIFWDKRNVTTFRGTENGSENRVFYELLIESVRFEIMCCPFDVVIFACDVFYGSFGGVTYMRISFWCWLRCRQPLCFLHPKGRLTSKLTFVQDGFHVTPSSPFSYTFFKFQVFPFHVLSYLVQPTA